MFVDTTDNNLLIESFLHRENHERQTREASSLYSQVVGIRIMVQGLRGLSTRRTRITWIWRVRSQRSVAGQCAKDWLPPAAAFPSYA